MKLVEFKIKRKTLAHEARLIRAQELKARQNARFLFALSDPAAAIARIEKARERQAPKGQREKPRFTVTQVARIRRQIAKKANTPVYDQADAFNLRQTLYRHRIDTVREHARAAHIALAYIKGKTYLSVEQKGALWNDGAIAVVGRLAMIAREVRAFGSEADRGCKPKDIQYWMEGGKTLAQEAELEEAGEDGISSKLAG